MNGINLGLGILGHSHRGPSVMAHHRTVPLYLARPLNIHCMRNPEIWPGPLSLIRPPTPDHVLAKTRTMLPLQMPVKLPTQNVRPLDV